MVIVFSSLNVSDITGLQLKYGGWMPSLNLTLAAVFMLLMLVAAALLICSEDYTNFGEFKLHFNQRCAVKSNFMVTTLIYRVALDLCLSLFSEVEEATITCFFIGIVFVVYLIGDKPYKAAYHKCGSAVLYVWTCDCNVLSQYAQHHSDIRSECDLRSCLCCAVGSDAELAGEFCYALLRTLLGV